MPVIAAWFLKQAINPRVWFALIAILVLSLVVHRIYLAGYESGALAGAKALSAANAVNAGLKSTYEDNVAAAHAQALRDTNSLQLSAIALEQSKDEKIKAISADLDAAIGRLSARPSRPASAAVPITPAAAGKNCTGANLFREDGDFLTREAALADAIVIERDTCYSYYDNAVEKVKTEPP